MAYAEGGVLATWQPAIGATAYTRGRVNATSYSVNDDVERVTVTSGTRSGNDNCTGGRLAIWECHSQAGHDAAEGVPVAWSEVAGQWDYCNWVATATRVTDFPRREYAYNLTCWSKYWGYNVPADNKVNVVITIPAKPYRAHGAPQVTASAGTVSYGQRATLTVSRSATQGNAAFARFRVWVRKAGGAWVQLQDQTASPATLTFTPSDYTGPTGGKLEWRVQEVHIWAGAEKTQDAYGEVAVRAGVVSAYGPDGDKRVGLVTAYDADGRARSVLITAYDADGNARQVV